MITASIPLRTVMVHPSQRNPKFSRRRPLILTLKRGEKARTIALRPVLVGSAIGVLALFLTAYIGATAYLIYRDDLLGAAVSRQVSMQYAYEERIAALRSELDRLSSRHAVQTEGVAEQLSQLLDKQDLIERRQATLDGIVSRARAAGVNVPGAGEMAEAPPAQETTARPTAASASEASVRPILATVRASLNDSETHLADALESVSAAADGEVDRLTSALAPIGVDHERGADEAPQGGPFIAAGGTLHFVERAALVARTIDDIAQLRRAASVRPVEMPVKAMYVSSRFGYRVDPFLKRQAFHSGLDFVASAGTTVRATAPGTVISAGWNGGYGQMVEVEHADGVSTRYGHLSKILVKVGAEIDAGAPVGRVGSTGRSTGPHLHYETLRDGKAVNPGLYLAAGKALRTGS